MSKTHTCTFCGAEYTGQPNKGLCTRCYARKLHNGTPDYKKPRQTANACTHCGNTKVHSKNLCRNCYVRQYHSGTPDYHRCAYCNEPVAGGVMHAACRKLANRELAKVKPLDHYEWHGELCPRCGKRPIRARGLCRHCYTALKDSERTYYNRTDARALRRQAEIARWLLPRYTERPVEQEAAA